MHRESSTSSGHHGDCSDAASTSAFYRYDSRRELAHRPYLETWNLTIACQAFRRNTRSPDGRRASSDCPSPRMPVDVTFFKRLETTTGFGACPTDDQRRSVRVFPQAVAIHVANAQFVQHATCVVRVVADVRLGEALFVGAFGTPIVGVLGTPIPDLGTPMKHRLGDTHRQMEAMTFGHASSRPENVHGGTGDAGLRDQGRLPPVFSAIARGASDGNCPILSIEKTSGAVHGKRRQPRPELQEPDP